MEANQKVFQQLLEENGKLQTKIEFLEEENKVVESIVEDARKLAECISSIPDDSGVGESDQQEDESN